ncbi:MAG: PaaI family thioesterase [Chloroflexota bacterium]
MSEKLLGLLARDRFAALVGIELVEVGPGHAQTRLALTDQHLNGVDIVQGGALFTLADLAFAAASNSRGNIAVAINANIAFFHPARGKVITAEAQEVSRSNRLATYNVDIFDEDKTIIARFTGTVYRKRDRIED